MMTALYIILAILIFGFLIAIHEFGHFITAKLSGVQVNEYSIGMGPKLLQRQKGETKYSLRLLPIGGYCALEGEDGESDNPRAFPAAAWWKRLIILFAGSGMNFLTGFVIVVLLFTFAFAMNTPPVLHGVMDGSAMQEQGLRAGDELYSINGRRIYFFSDFSLLASRTDGTCELVYIRDGEKHTVEGFRLEQRELTDANGETGMFYGLTASDREEKTVGTVLRTSWYECVNFSRMIWFGLQDLVTGRAGLKDMGGPAMIVGEMVKTGNASQTVGMGIANVLYFGAFIAVNLALMNLLPIPALDGGRILFLLIGTVFTAITHKKINPKYEAIVNTVAMVLLLLLMAVIFVKDIIWMVK